MLHSLNYAYRGPPGHAKGDFRKLWITRHQTAARPARTA